jgi:hypothetical protein
MGKKNSKGKREQATAPATRTPAEKAQATREKLNFTTEQILDAVKSVGHPA